MVRISEEELNRDEKRLPGTGPTNDQRLSGTGMVCDRKLTGRVNFGLNFEENYIWMKQKQNDKKVEKKKREKKHFLLLNE